VRISPAHRDDLLAHAREEAPNECCGYLPLRDGAVERIERAENVRRSPYGYELDHQSLFAANELEDQGYEVAVYHSHPRSPAEPSQTDINLAQYPNWVYVIVSPTDERGVRAWRIADGKVREEEVEIDDS
jgi:[CysO sulfur-carrier protein]-S-L-cysteine hydrolase